MNKEETQAAIAVMQAFVDGQEIQWREKSTRDGWSITQRPNLLAWNWQKYDYRIKQKTYWINIYPGENKNNMYAGCSLYETEQDANHNTFPHRIKCIKIEF